MNVTMEENRLPEAFREHMKRLLGEEEYRAFSASFSQGRYNALRVNLLKLTPKEFEAAAPFPVKKVPWTENGYFVDYRDAPGRHPWYRAGLYYLQEPSAMAPAQLLPVIPGDKVLDLCAAPGGKATELGARLGGRGVLVANEISSTRVRALVRNIELFGIRNAVVTNETPAKLAGRFKGYFDRVLVDAPCSGEGMFRKDSDAAKAWYPEKVGECAAIQREIIVQAADMLRPGGDMVYSTCTFEPEENEIVIAHLLRERPDMELVKIPCEGRYESFSRAFDAKTLAGKGYEVPGLKADEEAEVSDSEARTDSEVPGLKADEEAEVSDSEARTDSEVPGLKADEAAEASESKADAGSEAVDLTSAVRIWPHRAQGEGHFIALLHKKGSDTTAFDNGDIDQKDSDNQKHSDNQKNSDNQIDCNNQKDSDKKGIGRKDTNKRNSGDHIFGMDASRRIENGRSDSKKKKKKKENARPSSGKITAADTSLAAQFLERYAPDLNIDIDQYEIRDTHVFLMPKECPDIRGIGFLRAGLHAGELKKNRFEPAQELAMALGPAGGNNMGSRSTGSDDEGNNVQCITDDGIHVILPSGDERLAAYFRGEQIRLDAPGENGWRLVCVDGYPIGWGKLTGQVLKNHLGAGWRSS